MRWWSPQPTGDHLVNQLAGAPITISRRKAPLKLFSRHRKTLARGRETALTEHFGFKKFNTPPLLEFKMATLSLAEKLDKIKSPGLQSQKKVTHSTNLGSFTICSATNNDENRRLPLFSKPSSLPLSIPILLPPRPDTLPPSLLSSNRQTSMDR